jgi:multiple sugar transport system permease protein
MLKATRTNQRSSARATRAALGGIVFYGLLSAGAAVILLPVYWMFMASFMERGDVLATPINFVPPIWHPENYVRIFRDFDIGLYFANSVIVTGAVVILNVIFCSLVGYSLAKFDYPGKTIIFLFIMSTVMVPFAVLLIPLYLIVRAFNWINTYPGLIVPFGMSAFGIFLMRQFMLSVPDDYMDAARIDGAGEFSIFWRIVVPLSRPAIVTLAILSFVGNWDEFLWPLIITTTDRYRTLPIGLSRLLEAYQNEWNLLMAGSVVAALPLILLFLVMQRRFLEGMAGLSGLK